MRLVVLVDHGRVMVEVLVEKVVTQVLDHMKLVVVELVDMEEQVVLVAVVMDQHIQTVLLSLLEKGKMELMELAVAVVTAVDI